MAHPGMELIRQFLADSQLMAGSLEDQRSAMDRLAEVAEPPVGATVESTTLGGRPAERVVPDDGVETAAVLYLHGGAYTMGSPGTHLNLAGRLATATGCAVWVLDYRLAPEQPFPAAVDDAVSALGELGAAGIEPSGLALAGDSAGGGLTMATLLAMRRETESLPAAAVCFSPWVDLTQSGDSYDLLADRDPLISKANLDTMAAAYLAGADPTNELASPLFADEFRDLPPVLIDVGAHEVLLDDAVGLAERLEADGVDVSLTVWPEMIHVFQAFAGPLVPEAEESVQKAGRFLAGHLGLSQDVNSGRLIV